MNTNNRLQFRHHSEVFTGETLEEARLKAMDYVKTEMWYNPDYQDNNYGHSLFSEPTVIRYSLEGDEGNPHIIFAIGASTNETNRPENNKFCIIDIDKTEQEIEDLWEALEKAIKSLTIITLNSDTLNLYANKTEDGTYVSGDVKTAVNHIFDGTVIDNNLAIFSNTGLGEEGLYIYVDLKYNESEEEFTFLASQSDGTLKETTVQLPNNYLVRGEYDKETESIKLHMRSGETITVDCEELIAEWGVEGDASKTPIVLTREEVGYDGTDEHHHLEPWQDVLRADVRIANDRTVNILKKTTDGRYLYVDGVASNIVYYWNGDKSNVEEQLNKLNKIRISPDNDNIIWDRADGFFASAKLDYVTAENKLIFTTSTVSGEPLIKEIPLNSFDVIESITYDPTREELIIKYKNDKGETKTVRVPISGMIDEWEVLNNGHNVKLNKQRNISGKDILTADVNIAEIDNNILQEKGEGNLHALYVKGTADNIKYKDNITVETVIDDLINEDEEINTKLDKEIADRIADVERIDTTIGDGFSTDAHETITYKFNSEAEKLQGEIERSTEKDNEHDSRLDEQQAEIEAVSADSKISIKDIINNDNSIGIDKTDAVKPVISVNICHETDNAISVHNDGLYAHDYRNEVDDIYSKIDAVSGDVITEKTRAEEVETSLSNSIEAEKDAREAEVTRAISAETALRNDLVSGDTALDHKIENLETTLNSKIDVTENRLQTAIDSEKSRAEAADELLDGKITIEKERAMISESELRNAIAAETAAREEKDDELSAKIDAATLTFDDTQTVDLDKSTDNVVTANVKIANSDNNIIIHPEGTAYDGLFASATLEYEPTGNKIRLVTSNGAQEYIQLVGATLLDSIEYDSVNKILIIKYTDGTGRHQETTVGVTDLWNDWIIQNPSENSAVELSKVIGDPGNPDILSGRVLITEDNKNIIEIKNNGLYVDGTAISSATEDIACLKNEVKSLEVATLGEMIGQECGEGYEYRPDINAHYISGANSMMQADILLDSGLYDLSEAFNKLLMGSETPTAHVWLEIIGNNKHLKVDSRLSHGVNGGTTDDDLTITQDDTSEFTDTNVLRVVNYGEPYRPNIIQNGLYLSNEWGCGEYESRDERNTNYNNNQR